VEFRGRSPVSVERVLHDRAAVRSVGAYDWKKRHYGVRNMATGTVKWFNPTKGFGFIQPENGGNDVSVPVTAGQKAGLQGLDENARIEYELEEQRGKTAAVNLKLL
jgi:CspA family cold shock protein